MKILWVKTDFLHPTDRGGQIRTLETLRRLHLNNEVHYVAYDNPQQPEGVRRATEYCTRAYPVNRPIPKRGSPAFYGQLASNLFSELPLAVGRFNSPQMRNQLQRLIAEHRFDSIVCDFLAVAPDIPDMSRAVLFQHNVETMIWRRHAEHGATPLHRLYFGIQAARMFEIERKACLAASHVIAVSRNDANQMRELFGVNRVSEVSTGVDLDYFRRPAKTDTRHDLVFVGAMDWLPNIDGARYFISEVLPLIRSKRPGCTLVLAGRSPVPEIRAFADKDPFIQVTGSVPDIRPFLWEAAVSIVPLRIGGGTRLKIYEAMAAGTPVVSTPIGAEGLAVTDGQNIALADTPAALADRCVGLLEDRAAAERQAGAALDLVASRFSWEQVGRDFERILVESGRTQ
jgi:glycosyltransferase involved in cell wall biosynthesis